MDTLPVELLHEIAAYDKESYQAMLSIPLFARSLTPGIVVDYKISFGYNVTIKESPKGHKYIRWTLNGMCHREDGPAVEWAYGRKEWWLNGKRHRKDGPAIEWCHSKEWCTSKEWWLNGKRHREDGPAVEYSAVYKTRFGLYDGWWKNGKPCRTNGSINETEKYNNGKWMVFGLGALGLCGFLWYRIFTHS
jgi:hypothetical protein